MARKIRILILAFLLTALLTAPGCQEQDLYWEFTFEKDQEGWTGDFADLPVDYDEEIYELEFGLRDLPKEIGVNRKALMISGHNRSDDLFMFIKRQFTANDGIEAGETYLVTITMEIATDAPRGAVGIGGPPGESVFVKVGASALEPAPVVADGDSYYRMNVDKGNQAGEGRDAVLIGDAAKEDGSEDFSYALKSLDNINHQLQVTADQNGSLWIFIGTDSGFEGKTTIYYNHIQVLLEKVV